MSNKCLVKLGLKFKFKLTSIKQKASAFIRGHNYNQTEEGDFIT